MLMQKVFKMGNCPVLLICLSDGRVAFQVAEHFNTYTDYFIQDDTAYGAHLYNDEIVLCKVNTEEVYKYNEAIEYKGVSELMTMWLKSYHIIN
jgi:hypothetical protein